MATSSCTWALAYLLALAAMGTCSGENAPQNATSLFSSLEVVNQVMAKLAKESFPISDSDVKNAVKEMCPLIRYNYEVKNLTNSGSEVSVATQAMDVLLDSIVTESCDWLTSLLISSDPNFNCTIDYLSVVCAEMDLRYSANDLHRLLKDHLYLGKDLKPGGVTGEAKVWIETAFADYTQDEQNAVLSIINLEPSFSSCSSANGAVDCS